MSDGMNWYLEMLSTDCGENLGDLFRQHILPVANAGQIGWILGLQGWRKISAA